MRSWRVVGPGCGGALYRPTVSPADRETALIACDMTGAYLTANGGRRWRQLDFGAVARAFAFDPDQPRTIWAGASGLFRSDDAGGSWRLVLPPPATVRGERFIGDEADHRFLAGPAWSAGAVQAILVDPSDPRHLLIGVAGDRLQLLQSRDRCRRFAPGAGFEGKEWVAILPGPGQGFAYAVTDSTVSVVGAGTSTPVPLPPGVSRIASAAKGHRLFLVASAVESGGRFECRLLRLREDDSSWDDLTSCVGEQLPGSRGIRFPCLAAEAETVYLSVAEPPPEQRGSEQPFGILKSEEGGTAWRWSLRVAHDQPENRIRGWVETDFEPEWGGAPFGLGVRPGDPACCYATDWGTVYRTVNGGGTWEQLYARRGPRGGWTNRGVNVTNVYGVFFDPFTPGRAAMACTDVGLFLSEDDCRSWRHALDGIPVPWRNTCYWLVFDPDVAGRAWSAWSGCHDLPRAKMLHTDAYRSASGGVASTVDGMASWRPGTAGLPQGPVTSLSLDPTSPPEARRLLAAVFGHGVYASRDSGATWEEANDGIGRNRNAWSCRRAGPTVWLLVAWDLRKDVADTGALYRSDDDARSWQRVALPPGTGSPNCLAVEPENPGWLYLACWPVEADGRQAGGGLLASADRGSTWQRLFDEAAHAYGVSIGADGSLYLSTFEGRTWRSRDRGRTWAALRGIPFKWQKTVQPDPRDRSRIFVSTFGAGLWLGPARGLRERRGPRLRITALDVAPGEAP